MNCTTRCSKCMCAVFSFDFNSFLVLPFNWIEINQIWNGTANTTTKHNIYRVSTYIPNVLRNVFCFQSGTENEKKNRISHLHLISKHLEQNYFSAVLSVNFCGKRMYDFDTCELNDYNDNLNVFCILHNTRRRYRFRCKYGSWIKCAY